MKRILVTLVVGGIFAGLVGCGNFFKKKDSGNDNDEKTVIFSWVDGEMLCLEVIQKEYQKIEKQEIKNQMKQQACPATIKVRGEDVKKFHSCPNIDIDGVKATAIFYEKGYDEDDGLIDFTQIPKENKKEMCRYFQEGINEEE